MLNFSYENHINSLVQTVLDCMQLSVLNTSKVLVIQQSHRLWGWQLSRNHWLQGKKQQKNNNTFPGWRLVTKDSWLSLSEIGWKCCIKSLLYDSVLWKMMTCLQTPTTCGVVVKFGKSATNQKRSSVAIKLQIMLQYFNQYISKHTTFTLKVNTQFTVCVTLFTVLLVHGEQLVYLPCKLGNH